MRFLRRLLQPAEPDTSPPDEAAAAVGQPVERRSEPVKCRGCGRVRPPYVFAENTHHYCVECARRSWKLMRLKPVVRRAQDEALEASVKDEQAS